MTSYYKSNAERVAKFTELLQRLSRKSNWTQGTLRQRNYTEPDQFCFVGHIAVVLNPHFNEYDHVNPITYPTRIDGGKDLVTRLAESAFALYPAAVKKFFDGQGGAYDQTVILEFINDDPNDAESILVYINDNYKDSFTRVKKIVKHTIDNLENQ